MAAAGSDAFSSGLMTNRPKGPFFIDTGSCACALQEELDKKAWRCRVSATDGMYEGQDGKWFYAVNQKSSASLEDSMNSDSNPPNQETAYEIGDDRWSRIPDEGAPENDEDASCTGRNATEASSTFYTKLSDLESGGDNPCWQPGTLPLVIQDATSWNATGCKLGFFCQNNTDSDLPTYCPPFPGAQQARLAGQTTPPMGPLEPAICKEGFFCPPGGKEQIQCPAGSFCPQGAYEAQKCSFGAICPKGAHINRSVLPIVLLLFLDLMLVSLTFGAKAFAKKRTATRIRRHSRNDGVPFLKKALTFRKHSQFHSLPDDDIPMESRASGLKRTPTGFLKTKDSDYTYEGDEDQYSIDEKPDPDIQQFVKSLSRCTLASSFGLSFEFDNLSFQPRKTDKPVLSEVSGQIRSGTLWGVMGASGAGKTSFVNVLMGKQSHTGGITKVNGSPGTISRYKKIIGYVPQDDIVLPELTVRENILHSARIRLPSDWKEYEIQEHVDILLRCLHLYHVKNSLVGSPAAPVISGGERKRVSIGIELAAAPMALFLDEPTSGLDATSASSIMMTLKALSRLGITIVAIIHQPRHEIFEALDFIHLMGAGRVIYSGKEDDVQPYFEQCGYSFPKRANPADTIMDIIAGEGYLYKKTGDTGISHLIENLYVSGVVLKEELADSKTSQWKHQQESIKRTDTMNSPSTADAAALKKSVKMRGAPWYRQIYFCLCRALLQQYRRKSSFYFEIGVAALAGLLIGLAFVTQEGRNFNGMFQSPYELLSSAVNFSSVPQMSLLVGLAIGLTASSPGVKIFGEETLIYKREASSGHNRFAYYIGKVLSTFPRMILANLHFTILFLLLATPKISWGSAFVANLLYFYCIYGLASCVSMVTRREDGPLVATMASLIVGIISGTSPSLQTVRGWHMTWLWRSSPGTWLSEAYFSENILPYGYIYQIDQAAKQTGYHFNRFPRDMLMLLAIGSICRVLAFIGLRVFCRKGSR